MGKKRGSNHTWLCLCFHEDSKQLSIYPGYCRCDSRALRPVWQKHRHLYKVLDLPESSGILSTYEISVCGGERGVVRLSRNSLVLSLVLPTKVTLELEPLSFPSVL